MGWRLPKGNWLSFGIHWLPSSFFDNASHVGMKGNGEESGFWCRSYFLPSLVQAYKQSWVGFYIIVHLYSVFTWIGPFIWKWLALVLLFSTLEYPSLFFHMTYLSSATFRNKSLTPTSHETTVARFWHSQRSVVRRLGCFKTTTTEVWHLRIFLCLVCDMSYVVLWFGTSALTGRKTAPSLLLTKRDWTWRTQSECGIQYFKKLTNERGNFGKIYEAFPLMRCLLTAKLVAN